MGSLINWAGILLKWDLVAHFPVGSHLEVDRNQVYQEPNQEPGSVSFWKTSNRTGNQEVRKNENREPTSNQEPNQECKALFMVLPGTYWSNQEFTGETIKFSNW